MQEKNLLTSPEADIKPCVIPLFPNAEGMTEADLKLRLEEAGYPPSKTFQAAPGFIHRKILDGDMLISVNQNIANFNGYIELNASAALLWDTLKDACTIDTLASELESRFDIAHMKAIADVLNFLHELQEHQMVTVV